MGEDNGETQVAVGEDNVDESHVHLSLSDTVELVDQEQAENSGAISTIDVMSTEGVMKNTGEIEGGGAVAAVVDENEPASVAAVEMLERGTLDELDVNGSTGKQEIETVSASVESVTDESMEKKQLGLDGVMVTVTSPKLDSDVDLDTDQLTDKAQHQDEEEVAKNDSRMQNEAIVAAFVTEDDETVETSSNDQSEAVAVEPLVGVSVESVAPNETAQIETVSSLADSTVAKLPATGSVKVVEPYEGLRSKAASTSKIDLMAAKVTPPTSELSSSDDTPSKPEKMSPVKSLASRFEGKREQSLDSLKIRTVREFFPEERSIRVGAEKKKYEAQAQEQKIKAKAEQEAKAKYKAGPGFKFSEKDAASDTSVPEVKESAMIVEDSEVNGGNLADSAGFTTPDAAASRKKYSFDEGYAFTDSPSKSSDDAPKSSTPVKSIASRFEGKYEQSLDDLKFRTVREFYSDEHSVRVSSEKEKLEAQSQQAKSLDDLKFRAVREFFSR